MMGMYFFVQRKEWLVSMRKITLGWRLILMMTRIPITSKRSAPRCLGKPTLNIASSTCSNFNRFSALNKWMETRKTKNHSYTTVKLQKCHKTLVIQVTLSAMLNFNKLFQRIVASLNICLTTNWCDSIST